MPHQSVNDQPGPAGSSESTPARLHKVAPGALVTYEKKTARIVSFERGPAGRLEALIDNGSGLQRVPIASLFAAIADLEPATPDAETEAEFQSPLLAELPDEERKRIETRYRDLKQAATGSRHGTPEADRARGVLSPTYDPLVHNKGERWRAKSEELKARGESANSVPQLRRQLDAVDLNGIEALIHGNKKTRKHQLAGADEEVITVLTEFLHAQPGRARTSNKALLVLGKAALAQAGVGQELTDYKLRIIIGELSRALDLHHEAKGRERVALKPDVVYGRRLVSRPGEIVQIDATTTNIHVFDPRLGWIRSTILTAIDVFTRCVLALRVITGSATTRDVTMLLWDIGRPTVTRSGYPYELIHHHGMPRLIAVNHDPDEPVDSNHIDILGTKPALIPSAIVVDHGREFDSEHLMSACARIDVDVIFCPPRAAHAKGVVESLHNGWREVQSLLTAYKGANVNNHPKGVEDLATLTAQDLRDALWEYVLEIYHWREHQGLAELHNSQTPLCPAGVFEAYLESGGEVTVPTDPFRLIQLLSSKKCLVQPYGININGRVYNNATLVSLRQHLARGVGTPATPLLVFYDRWDISRVYTRHPVTGEWLCIPRAGESPQALMPCSDAFDTAIRKQLIRGDSRPLNATDLTNASAEFVNRWAPEKFTDRNEARILALEAGRAHDYAHDLADASPEFRELAFGSSDDRETLPGDIVQTTADSDAILDSDLADLADQDEEIDLDNLDDYSPDNAFLGRKEAS